MTTNIKSRPVIFTGESLPAILADRKTQTRRVVEPQPLSSGGGMFGVESGHLVSEAEFIASCPLGHVGDSLWVREKWGRDRDGELVYAAGFDGPEEWVKWGSPIHMEREWSRITLEITDVRVQRVQDISEEDAIAEGIVVVSKGHRFHPDAFNSDGKLEPWWPTAREAFFALWDSINAKRGHPWSSNPWVFALTFRRIA